MMSVPFISLDSSFPPIGLSVPEHRMGLDSCRYRKKLIKNGQRILTYQIETLTLPVTETHEE